MLNAHTAKAAHAIQNAFPPAAIVVLYTTILVSVSMDAARSMAVTHSSFILIYPAWEDWLVVPIRKGIVQRGVGSRNHLPLDCLISFFLMFVKPVVHF